MNQNIPVAVALAVIGSFCVAWSAKLQHGVVRHEVHANQAKQRLSIGQLMNVLRTGRWWLGVGLASVSMVTQVVGLSMAPVSVVQPIGLLAFPWSVLLAGRALGPRKAAIVTSTAATVVVTFAFVVVMSQYAATPPGDIKLTTIALGAGVLYACTVLLALLGSSGPKQWRVLFWPCGGALLYGLEAAVVKWLLVHFETHVWWQGPLLWCTVLVLLAGNILGGVMVQHGYAVGQADVVVASWTVTSPVAAVLFGVAVLGEGRHLPALPAAILAVLACAAIVGVATLAHLRQDGPISAVA